MQEQKNIVECYNKTAENYASKFMNELEEKHLDRILLKSFCEQNKNKGRLIDLGCGPGQTTRFLYDSGFENIVGADISPEMVNVAKKHHPTIEFEIADLLNLTYADDRFGSAIAFYAIVHFDYEQIKKALEEIKRVLKKNGELLFSFHIGNEIIALDNFLDKEVNIKFCFFEVERVKKITEEVGFEIIDIIKREPYKTEHQTERAYFWIKKDQ